MKLDTGYYKIKWRRRQFAPISYLRVTYQGKDKYFQFDHGQPYKVTLDDETFEIQNFTILKKITKPLDFRSPLITVSFNDEDGDHCEMKARNLSSFERILEQFPRLKNALK